MIVVVGGIKGGIGKSTLAMNLTIMRALSDKRVLLIDADEQKSVSKWALQREIGGYEIPWKTIHLAGEEIGVQIKEIQGTYDDIIIDVGGRDTTTQRAALLVADLFLVPFPPRSLDIWTIPELRVMIKEILKNNKELKSYALLSRADPTGKENQEAVDILKTYDFINYLPVIIRERKAFSKAATQGQGVMELKIKDKKAIEEVESLYHYVFNKIAK